MNTKIWIGVVVVVLVVAAVAFLLLRQDEPELDTNTVQLSAGCNDIIDVSVLPDDKKMEACKDLIDSRRRDLEARGFEPGECRVVAVEAVDCGPALGTELVCTVRCGDDDE